MSVVLCVILSLVRFVPQPYQSFDANQMIEYWLWAVSVSSFIVSLSSIVSYCLFFKLVVLTNYQLYKKKPFKMPEVWHVIWKTAHVSEHNADPNFSLYLRIVKTWKLKNLWKKIQSCDRLLCKYTWHACRMLRESDNVQFLGSFPLLNKREITLC